MNGTQSGSHMVDPNMPFYIDDVSEFHQRYDILDSPAEYLERHAAMRQIALLEELQELGQAFANGDLASYLDALIDLNYFNLGTILLLGEVGQLGPSNEPSWQLLNHMRKDHFRGNMLADPRPPIPGQYTFLLGAIYTQLGSAFHSISMAKRGSNPTPYFNRAGSCLVEVHRTIIDHSFLCGLDFVAAWERVHHANMQKKRAEKASDSKRGSKYDVIKPEGWVPPDLRDLVGEEITTRPLIFDKVAA